MDREDTKFTKNFSSNCSESGATIGLDHIGFLRDLRGTFVFFVVKYFSRVDD